MTNFAHGHTAEAAAVKYLQNLRYEILEQNYRTRYCEIDIIAKKDKVIYFIEVKYRQSPAQGGGLDYITPKKQKQMNFAARVWLSGNNWAGDYTLSAIEVSSPAYEVTEFIDEL